jgi:hypothetical protein
MSGCGDPLRSLPLSPRGRSTHQTPARSQRTGASGLVRYEAHCWAGRRVQGERRGAARAGRRLSGSRVRDLHEVPLPGHRMGVQGIRWSTQNAGAPRFSGYSSKVPPITSYSTISPKSLNIAASSPSPFPFSTSSASLCHPVLWGQLVCRVFRLSSGARGD